jgi:hypothetical protein
MGSRISTTERYSIILRAAGNAFSLLDPADPAPESAPDVEKVLEKHMQCQLSKVQGYAVSKFTSLDEFEPR